MARSRGENPVYVVSPCDYCAGSRGRNKQVVHILSRPSRDELEKHLSERFKNKPAQDFFLALWDTAHLLYSNVAFQRRQPLALVYLEEHGVRITNKFDWINKYRGGKGQVP